MGRIQVRLLVVLVGVAWISSGGMLPPNMDVRPAAAVTLPNFHIVTPQQGAVYQQHQVVFANYSCSPGSLPLASCEGNYCDAVSCPGAAVPSGTPLDTSKVGTFALRVLATDTGANGFGTVNSYTVVADSTPPVVSIVTPQQGATFHQHATIYASYSCADEPGGAGMASCVGPVASGAALDTSTLGSHTFTVQGTDQVGNGATAKNSYNVVKSDSTPPVVSIVTPIDGATFHQNATIYASYSCTDEPGGSGMASCTGPVASGAILDTATLGSHTFTVQGADKLSNTAAVTHSYNVVDNDQTPPAVVVTAPSNGAVYTLGQDVNSEYSCADEAGGSGLASCAGPVPSGAPVDTSVLGLKTFAVTGTDNDGNSRTETNAYSVVEGQPAESGQWVVLPLLSRH